jgi:hypothetical protein
MGMCLRRMVALLLSLAACGLAQTQAPPAPIDLKPDSSGAVPPGQIRELLRRAEERDLENDKRQRDYTYIERVERHTLDKQGGVKKSEAWTSEVLEIYGEPVERRTAKDDQPLPASEAKKEDGKIQKLIDKRKNESEEERRKRLEREDKEREEDRKFVLEIGDAFNFRLIGSEALTGATHGWLRVNRVRATSLRIATPRCSANSKAGFGSIKRRRNG